MEFRGKFGLINLNIVLTALNKVGGHLNTEAFGSVQRLLIKLYPISIETYSLFLFCYYVAYLEYK